MDQQKIKAIMSGRQSGLAATLLRCLLTPAGWVYGSGALLRRRAYRRRLRPSHRAAAPVISVGNITAGGTGKTPMVAWLVKQLAVAGASPAVLIRGYKAAGGASDEAKMLASLTGQPVVVNADRAAGAAEAIAAGADVLVLDDGFQHLRLHRDLDIVLIDATCPLGYGHPLPRGLLREPVSALAEADAIVITRSDAVEPGQLRQIRDCLGRLAPQASLHLAVHRPVALIDQFGGELPPESLAGRRVCAFCGIGNPEAFFATLAGLGAELACRRAFDDHAEYTDSILTELSRCADQARAEALVTTQKDFVKLPTTECARPVWQLVVEMDITSGQDELLAKALAARQYWIENAAAAN